MDHEEAQETCTCRRTEIGRPRRDVLAGGLALLLAPADAVLAAGEPNPKTIRPQPGDKLAYLSGENKDKKVMASDLQVGGEPRLAYPVDPATDTIRSGSRVNQVMLVRVDASTVTGPTTARAADGILAYSAICTHNGCPITLLNEDKRSVVCTCHGSRFDLADNGTVLDGPATRRLAGLPVTVSDGFVTVAGAFSGALGPPAS